MCFGMFSDIRLRVKYFSFSHSSVFLDVVEVLAIVCAHLLTAHRTDAVLLDPRLEALRMEDVLVGAAELADRLAAHLEVLHADAARRIVGHVGSLGCPRALLHKVARNRQVLGLVAHLAEDDATIIRHGANYTTDQENEETDEHNEDPEDVVGDRFESLIEHLVFGRVRRDDSLVLVTMAHAPAPDREDDRRELQDKRAACSDALQLLRDDHHAQAVEQALNGNQGADGNHYLEHVRHLSIHIHQRILADGEADNNCDEKDAATVTTLVFFVSLAVQVEASSFVAFWNEHLAASFFLLASGFYASPLLF